MGIKSSTCKSSKTGRPLTEYETEHEARQSAKYLNKQYNTKFIAYPCDKCGKWHLSPKNRHTPNSKCYLCAGSNGSAKALYETENSAQKRAKIIQKEQGVKLNVYRCPYNDGWHLTKRNI